jgi:hypothetical protein
MDELHSQNPPVAGAEQAGRRVTEAEVREALNRLVRSKALAGSEKLISFLTFVVETTMRGDGDHLKETVIGNSVFGRAPDYDPKADTIVRSQAWRLRTKLKEYYETEGAGDAIRILLRRGSYVPRFARLSSDTADHPEPLRRTG